MAIALYTLRSSAEYATIAHLFGILKASVCLILQEYCYEVWRIMAPEYLPQDFATDEKITKCGKGFQQMGLPIKLYK